MSKPMGSWWGVAAKHLLQAASMLFLASAAVCHAQFETSECAPANNITPDSQGLVTMDPVTWAPGHTYTVSITGSYPIILYSSSGCPDVTLSAWEWPNYPNVLQTGPPDPYISLSNLTYISPTLTTFTASVSAGAPTGYIQLELASYVGSWDYWGVQIQPPPPPIPPQPPQPPNACSTPVITSVLPNTWLAGKTYQISVIGTGFTTIDQATSNCPATPMTVSVPTGSVDLSSVTVVSSTEIIATVAPANTDPDETAVVELWGSPSVLVFAKPVTSTVNMSANSDIAASPNSLNPVLPGMVAMATANALIESPCGPGFSIVNPKDGTSYPLSANNTTATDSIPFQSNGGRNSAISWQVQLSYAASTGKGASSATKDFSSIGSSSVSETFQSMGGQGNVHATCSASTGSTITTIITGAPISQSDIIDRLNSLYGAGQPTPMLMTCIARHESSLQQFVQMTLFGVGALWPNESHLSDGSPDGSHIGLMQMPNTMQDAFDWTINTQDGVNLFFEKLKIAAQMENQIQKAHPKLRNLTAYEMENMALELYGDSPGGRNPTKQYYIPTCVGGSGTACTGGTWNWIVNSGNPGGVAYVTAIRRSCN